MRTVCVHAQYTWAKKQPGMTATVSSFEFGASWHVVAVCQLCTVIFTLFVSKTV